MKLLAIFWVVSALVLFGLAAHALKTGRARFRFWIDDRKTQPFQYWSTIILYLLFAFSLLWLAFSG
jgi:uncharacterized BrkB/YihY/UPF0761 family membrane protein